MKSYNSIYNLFTAPPTILTSMNLRKQLTIFAAIGVLNTAVDMTHYTATITDLWILQPVAIWLLIQLLRITNTLGLNMAKPAATSISLMWNFVWYRIVFQGTKKKHLRRSVFSWLRQLGSNQRPIG